MRNIRSRENDVEWSDMGAMQVAVVVESVYDEGDHNAIFETILRVFSKDPAATLYVCVIDLPYTKAFTDKVK